MKKFLFFIALLALNISCTSEQEQLKKSIDQLEKQIEENTSADAATQLLSNYQSYIEKFPGDETLTPRYHYRAAGLLYRMNKFQEAEKYLKRSLQNFPDDENNFNCGMLLGNIYDQQLNNKFVAQTIYQNLVVAFPNQDIGEAKKLLGNGLPPTDQRLNELQQQIFNDSTGVINYQKANDYINSVELYALINPTVPTMADNLFKAAETARTIRAHEKALSIYEWIYQQYQEHPKAPQALFLQAFTYDNELGKIEKARELYQQFIQEYPSDEFADDAQFLLKNLGKTNEEIIQSFEEQQAN